MAEYLFQEETLIALADKVRELSGSTDEMSVDVMTSNLGEANSEVSAQADLIAQLKDVVDNLPEAGSGSSSETVYVTGTVRDTYESDPAPLIILSNGEQITIPSGTTATINVPKDSIIVLIGDTSAAWSTAGEITTLVDDHTSAPYFMNSCQFVGLVTGNFEIGFT